MANTEVHITMADTKPENNEVEVEEKTELSQLFPGNHIAVTGWPYYMYHHGISIYAEYCIVDYGGENKKDATTKNLWGEKRLPAIRENRRNRRLDPWDCIGFFFLSHVKNMKKHPAIKKKRRNYWIIHDAESIDADTNGQEMTVERQEIHRNYNWSCHDTKLMKSALSFAYTVLPCAGGTDHGRSQREDQVHSQIYEASLKFVSKCPYPSEYMNKTLEKCVDVCGSYIQDGNCAFHCMRESSKTRLVEFCAKPKLLFEFCPEYDPVDQTFQKDTASLCNSTFNRTYYASSDIYFCNPDNCLQLLESDVRSGATTLMTRTTEMNGGDIQEVWPLKIWLLILVLVVGVIVLAIFLACILNKRRHLQAKKKMTKNVETAMQKLVKG